MKNNILIGLTDHVATVELRKHLWDRSNGRDGQHPSSTVRTTGIDGSGLDWWPICVLESKHALRLYPVNSNVNFFRKGETDIEFRKEIFAKITATNWVRREAMLESSMQISAGLFSGDTASWCGALSAGVRCAKSRIWRWVAARCARYSRCFPGMYRLILSMNPRSAFLSDGAGNRLFPSLWSTSRKMSRACITVLWPAEGPLRSSFSVVLTLRRKKLGRRENVFYEVFDGTKGGGSGFGTSV